MRFKHKKAVRFIALMLCTIIFATSFSGCARGGSGKSVSWLLNSAPRNLDPQTAKSESELLIIKNCFKGLFEKNADGEIFSSIVEHYGVSEDGRHYNFYLYDDIYWSIYEGREIKRYAEITAQDFAFAIKRVFTDNPNADVMKILKSIKNADKVLKGASVSKLSVSCKDDKTLSISLSEKNPAFLEAFCDSTLFPCNEQFFNSTSGRYGLSPDTIIFNGSFCLSSWGESSIRLIRNTEIEEKARPEAVTLYLPKSTREHVALLEKGDIDAAELSSEKFDKITKKDSFSAEKNTSVVWALVFNTQSELWKNKNLRSAVANCTDRSVITSKEGEHHSAASRLVSGEALVFSENYASLSQSTTAPEFNADKAKSLYSKGLLELEMSQILNAEVLVPDKALCKDSFAALNQVYQRELSLYFSPVYLSQDEVLEKVRAAEFSAALVPLYMSAQAPSSTLEYFSSASPLCIVSAGKTFSSKFISAQSKTDANSAAKAFSEAENMLYNSSLAVPLFFENSYFVSQKNASGFMRDKSGTVLFHSVNVK